MNQFGYVKLAMGKIPAIELSDNIKLYLRKLKT